MYQKQIKITNAHPENKPTKSMTITLEGGSPWFGYIWIDGEIYTITLGGRYYKIKKTQ